MAEVENINNAVLVSEDEQYGEETYVRQVYVCYKSGVEVEEGLPQRFAKSFEVRKAAFAVETELNVCGGGEGESDGDLLIFPEMVRYKALKETEVDAFVEDVLVNGKAWTSGIQQRLKGSFVFVCADDRDAHAFLDKFEEEIGSRGLSDQVFVKSCSPLGGHKYSGNLIVFSPDSALDLSGDWSLTPEDVPALLDHLVAKRDKAEKVEEQHYVPNGNVIVEHQPVEKPGGGCCQGVNGVSCCQNQTPESFKQIEEEEGSVKDAEPVKKEEGSVKLNWFRSMEKQEHLFLGAAVVGAVATIAVTCSFFRRSA